MTRKHEDSAAGRAANRIAGALFMAGVLVLSHDSERDANEGLGQREILALQQENARPWGVSLTQSAIECRARQAGYGECTCITGRAACPGSHPGQKRRQHRKATDRKPEDTGISR